MWPVVTALQVRHRPVPMPCKVFEAHGLERSAGPAIIPVGRPAPLFRKQCPAGPAGGCRSTSPSSS